ncbi:MAG TPA: hypothetical protein VIK78_19675 [Ruminiclostridium sp.]
MRKVDLSSNAVNRKPTGLDAVYESDTNNNNLGGNTSVNNSGNVTGSGNSNKGIKIAKKSYKPLRSQVGWRINDTTIERIQEEAFNRRMNINEFAQELLDKALDEMEDE